MISLRRATDEVAARDPVVANLIALAGPIAHRPRDPDGHFGALVRAIVFQQLAGAAASLPKYDKDAGKDPFYQLTAGAVLERAGDQRCIERYEAARALDPKLVVADVLLARAVLLEMGPAKGKPVIEELKK